MGFWTRWSGRELGGGGSQHEGDWVARAGQSRVICSTHDDEAAHAGRLYLVPRRRLGLTELLVRSAAQVQRVVCVCSVSPLGHQVKHTDQEPRTRFLVAGPIGARNANTSALLSAGQSRFFDGRDHSSAESCDASLLDADDELAGDLMQAGVAGLGDAPQDAEHVLGACGPACARREPEKCPRGTARPRRHLPCPAAARRRRSVTPSDAPSRQDRWGQPDCCRGRVAVGWRAGAGHR